MDIQAKFICTRFVEFKGENGQTVRGYVPYVLNEDNDDIIKCKMEQNGRPDLHCGDDVTVEMKIRGKYVKYALV